MASVDPFIVEVVYATPERAIVQAFRVMPPATVAEVLARAAADPAFHGIDVAGSAVGIFGQPAAQGRVLQPGDRLELYRPLAADPKRARRDRVQRARQGPAAHPSAVPRRPL